MNVKLHPHTLTRMYERGATEDEVIKTVEGGESFQAKYGRTGFRRNFMFDSDWKGKHYKTKQIEAIAVKEEGGWLVLTVLVKLF